MLEVKEKQDGRTIIHEGEFIVTNLSLEKQCSKKDDDKNRYFEELKNRIFNFRELVQTEQMPLTTDVVARGYSVTQEELETIKKLNAYEIILKEELGEISPNCDENSNYYIIEDGRIFKCVDGYEYYGLNLTTMEWENNQAYMDLFYNSYLKHSELINFRDYYSKKVMLRPENGLRH